MYPRFAPAYPGYFADPFVWRSDGSYYAVGTGPEEAAGDVVHSDAPTVFPLLRSPDLVTWRAAGHALVRPDEALGCNFWAPEVAYADGCWYLYYSVGHGDRLHQLRVATSTHPLGPYRDRAQLTDPRVVPFAIDPHPFRDADGRWYLFHARDFLDVRDDALGRVRAGTALVVCELETMTRLSPHATTVLRARCDWQRFAAERPMYGGVFDWHTLEGPCVVREGDRYYCFYSGGCWQTATYGVDYTVADRVLGPYDEVSGHAYPRLLRTVSGALVGPGHCSVVAAPDGGRRIVYHAWDPHMTARRMYIDCLRFDSAGPVAPHPDPLPTSRVEGKPARPLTMKIARSALDAPFGSAEFHWLAGIEDTFITAPSPKTGRTLDEYELTEHYERWRADIDLLASLGIRSARYGIPWHRINPERGKWDFTWADRPLERLLEVGIAPVVDLVHYGLPAWIERAFLSPDFPQYMAEYAAKIAERFRGRIHAYTPLNEPRVTAWYCGKLGWWPPFRRGWRGFVAVMLGVCRGIVHTVRALDAVDREIVAAHVDATDLYEAADPLLLPEVRRRQEIVFLALDLVSGRVGRGHALYAWLLANGASEADLAWFEANAVSLDIVGINLYPLFSQKRLVRGARGLRTSMPYAKADIVERLAALYWERYRRPLFISETASEGTLARRAAWLDDSVTAVRRVRSRGIPLVGYTWWPLFALVTWGYREGRKETREYLKQMGLWDLEPTEAGLARVETPLVARFRDFVAGGAGAVGPLAPLEHPGGEARRVS